MKIEYSEQQATDAAYRFLHPLCPKASRGTAADMKAVDHYKQLIMAFISGAQWQNFQIPVGTALLTRTEFQDCYKLALQRCRESNNPGYGGNPSSIETLDWFLAREIFDRTPTVINWTPSPEAGEHDEKI
jgi:hypothetical protein